MAQWEYILQSYRDPGLLVGDARTEAVLRYHDKAAAEKVLWSLDCLLVMGLRILQVPAGADLTHLFGTGPDERDGAR